MWNPLDPDRRAVRRGAKLLDREKPDWFKLVDLDRLNLDSSLTCILGQVYGDYYAGRVDLGIDYEQVRSHAFVGGMSIFRREEFWRHEVERRMRDVETQR